MSILLEYIIVFVVLYLINYFMYIKKNIKYKVKNAPTEINYLKKIYNIKIKKENYKSYIYVTAFINTFIMDTIYIILIYLVKGWILKVIIGIILIILMTIICYGILGRYYIWKDGDK